MCVCVCVISAALRTLGMCGGRDGESRNNIITYNYLWISYTPFRNKNQSSYIETKKRYKQDKKSTSSCYKQEYGRKRVVGKSYKEATAAT